jgi:ribosomal protein S18 acetylase RimI-like enzyme
MASPQFRVGEVTDDTDALAVFERERVWSVYALCDLEQPFRSSVRYIGAWRGGDLLSVVQIFAPEGFISVIPYGDADGIAAIFASDVDLPADAFFQAREPDVALLGLRYATYDLEAMHRMAVATSGFHAVAHPEAEIRRLGPADAGVVSALYAAGEQVMFAAYMLGGIFMGAWWDDRLVAVAGVHAHSIRHDMAVIGGVFTHPAYRGRGLAAATTAAVVDAARALGIHNVALNVRRDNEPAIRAYRRIGFTVTMDFVEGTLRAT